MMTPCAAVRALVEVVLLPVRIAQNEGRSVLHFLRTFDGEMPQWMKDDFE